MVHSAAVTRAVEPSTIVICANRAKAAHPRAGARHGSPRNPLPKMCDVVSMGASGCKHNGRARSNATIASRAAPPAQQRHTTPRECARKRVGVARLGEKSDCLFPRLPPFFEVVEAQHRGEG